MSRFALFFGLILACSATPATTEPADGGGCPKGYYLAPLGQCAIDENHPPCGCVDLDQAFCCGGDVCCGPTDTTCGLGVPTCTDGIASCGPSGGRLSFQSTCD